jgi:uncharacterized membrane protein YphA (DoxX/SURF4 family)
MAARALTGSTYALLGHDALRAPGARVDQAPPMLAAMRKVALLPGDDELVVRGNAGVQMVAGTFLTLGILPRTSALALIGSLVPTTIAGARVLGDRGSRVAQDAAHSVSQEHGDDRWPAARGTRQPVRKG